MEAEVVDAELVLPNYLSFKRIQMYDKYPKGQSRGRHWKHLKQIIQAENYQNYPPDEPNYVNIESPPSMHPCKRICDITGYEPDITAPGVSVIAAYTEAEGPTNQEFDNRRIQFNSVSGTSMSCPHISGIVGLLRSLYPSWTPAAIKSAIMTTATTLDNKAEPILNATNSQATPFSYGAGHVQPNSAIDPGLVYDITTNDYFNFLCALGYNETQMSLFSKGPYKCHKNFSILNLNYPSITVPNLSGSVTVTRTLKNVGAPGTYIVHVQNPSGITVSVKPSILEFKNVGEEKRFEVKLKVKKGKATKSYVFGKMIWSDGKHYVKSPLVVKAI